MNLTCCPNCGAWHNPEDKTPPTERATTEREERLEDALQKIAQWSDAYPVDIFIPPNLDRCRELLKAGGESLGAVSGASMRHVIEGVGKIAKEALRDGDSGL